MTAGPVVRRIAAVPVLLLLVALVVGLHAYLIDRLVVSPALPGAARDAIVAVVAVLALAIFLEPVVQRLWHPDRARIVAWPAALWMGFAFLALLGLAVTDATLWLLGAAASDTEGPLRLRALAVVAFTAVVGGVALRSGLRFPEVRRVDVPLARWPCERDGYRVVQISDIHIGPMLGADFASALVDRVNALEPDLIAITGDLVDGPVRHLAEAVSPFGDLAAPDGVWFVTGNHDFYSGAEAWSEHVASLGIRVLRNAHVTIGDGSAAFDLAGVDDHHGDWLTPGSGADLDRALSGRNPERPVLLLAHDPSTFKQAWRRDVDLQLSGHTHGGQIWPFTLLVRLAVPFVAGLYRRAAATLYVSRGTGFWGPPMRLLAPAEITELTLRSPQPPPG